jgi:hypothetical protein
MLANFRRRGIVGQNPTNSFAATVGAMIWLRASSNGAIADAASVSANVMGRGRSRKRRPRLGIAQLQALSVHGWDIVQRPTSSSSWLNIVDAVPYFTARITELLKAEDHEIRREVLRELLVNAHVHRCYRTRSPIQIKVRSGEVEIVNPGGLVGGLTTDTLLYSPPTYRNCLLADAARQFGYCEWIGSGIDKVYYFSLLAGFDFPALQAGSNSFSAVVRTNRDHAFAKFINDYAGGLNIALNDLIICAASTAVRR